MADPPKDLSALAKKPARMHLVNLATNEDLEALFNPTELEEKLSVNYNKLAVLGLSHQPLQYQQTTNHTFDFELAFRPYDNDNRNRSIDAAEARKFLLSCCVPARGAGDIIGGAPPRVLFIWPNLASLTAVIAGTVTIKHTLFGRDGTPLHFAAKLTLEEIRDKRIFADEIRANGTLARGGK